MATLNPQAVKYLVVHSSNSSHIENLTAADLERQHRAQGCLSIKYHFVIRRDGTLEAGRPLDQIGLHASRQWNNQSIGICMVGGMGTHAANYTLPQFETLYRTLRDLLDTFPNALPVGWNDLSPADPSPYFDVKNWWAD